MELFKRLFHNRKKDNRIVILNQDNQSGVEFDDKLNNHLKSMIEVSLEYVNWKDKEIENVYIFCSTEEAIFFHFFFGIKGQFVERHKVNEFLEGEVNVSTEQQSAADDIWINDLQSIINHFVDSGRQIPTRIKLACEIQSKRMEADFSYENILIGSEKMEEDLIQEWIIDLKNK